LAVPNQGWSLLEMAIVSVIVGILASMAIPSMMSGMGKNQLQSSMGQVKGAIQEAQRAAIKNGQSCTVTLTTGTSATVTGSTGCVSSPVTLASDITLSIPTGSSPFSFSYKGNTTSDLNIVLASTKTTQQYCLVVSSGIGIMRSGVYDESRTSDKCQSSF
jgi:prepilin-type N-terminal cleavage/methylation domain-containing protein